MLKRFIWLIVGGAALPVVVGLILAKRPDVFDARPKDVIPENAPSCDGREDVKFGAFLARFKTDQKFRESRTILPLRYTLQDATPYYLSPEEFRKRTWTIVVGDEMAAKLRGAEKCDEQIESGGGEAILLVTQHACGDDPFRVNYKFAANLSRTHVNDFCYFLKEVSRYRDPFYIR